MAVFLQRVQPGDSETGDGNCPFRVQRQMVAVDTLKISATRRTERYWSSTTDGLPIAKMLR